MHVSSSLNRLKRLENLEREVKEKTQEILDAERMVAAGRIATMVGHDLRGPMQTISNAVYLMEGGPDNFDELLKIIKEAIQRSSEMLDELRSKTRDTPLSIIEINLVPFLNSLIKGVRVPDSVEIDLRVGDGLEAVRLDPLKMRRVLDNLVLNALEAMPDGGVLTLDAGIVEDEIRIVVSDTGVGIPEEEIGRLFKPFHTTKRIGSGLGLAYCKRVVEAHGGTISVVSEAGRGTKVNITLPQRLEKQ
jgi:signal transduction histidine kinase